MAFFWITDKKELPGGLDPLSLTIGNFDGVHQGHQQLIKASVDWAKKNNGASVVLTFQPHPLQVLRPDKKHPRLFDFEDQKNEFLKWGVRGVFLQSFTREFSQMSSDQFFFDFLIPTFGLKHLVVGHDFSFGKGREGTLNYLKEKCFENNIQFSLIPAFKIENEIVSTSLIRKNLESGDLENVSKYLGRAYHLKGLVQKGDQRGRTLGYRTANILPSVDFFPRTGVYATKAWIRGSCFSSVTNIGLNLTFVEGENHPIKVETHLFNFSEDIYGENIQIDLIHYLRPEKKFSSIQELTNQIAQDVEQAQRILK